MSDDILFEGPTTWFGRSVSISEDGIAIVVGAPLNGENRYEYGAGSVRVFEYGEGTGINWVATSTAKLLATDLETVLQCLAMEKQLQLELL